MKKYILSFVTITLLLVSTNVFAGVKKNGVEKTYDKEAIVENLKVGLTSDNYGIRVSSAYVLGQLLCCDFIAADDASETIIPLLKIMKSEETDEARIVAALALYQLKSDRGAMILGYAARNDDSKRFSKFSDILYREYNQNYR
ncbi:MAG: hypothetical protein WB779_14050 [Ignavibacteriaceae bacterium]